MGLVREEGKLRHPCANEILHRHFFMDESTSSDIRVAGRLTVPSKAQRLEKC